MLLATDIPLSKVNGPEFREFFGKFCKWHIPDESTLRKNFVPILFEEKLAEVRSKFEGKYLWVALDETAAVCGRYATTFYNRRSLQS